MSQNDSNDKVSDCSPNFNELIGNQYFQSYKLYIFQKT